MLDRRARASGAGQAALGFAGDGFAELVPAGELRELTPAEQVAAELEILGIDLSQHVLSFYTDLLHQLGVTRSAGLHRCRAGAPILVAGVKIATQTPAIRSGLRIIFTTLDDATGPVDLAFFESVQPRCAARVFGSWLLLQAHGPEGDARNNTEGNLDSTKDIYSASKRKRQSTKDPTKFKNECNTCGERFTRSTTLREHSRTHTNERPFPCSSCSENICAEKRQNSARKPTPWREDILL